MTKRLRITISGYGGEYTVGSIPDNKVEFWLSKDDEELYEHITSYDSDSDDPNYIGMWHENDNVIHSYGASENNLVVRIYFGDDEVREFTSLADFENTFELEEVDFNNLEDGAYLVCYSGEKGVFWDGSIDIEDDEVFDLNNITILTNDLFGENFVIGAQYKDEDMENIGASTDGKSFDYSITYREDEI
jgi:hypothetical protein